MKDNWHAERSDKWTSYWKESIKITLDGRHLVTLLALPRELRELAAGFLICEGVLKRIEDISFDICARSYRFLPKFTR